MFSKFFNKTKKTKLPISEQKYNNLWDLYSNSELDDINHNIYVLCDYESGINGDGHSGFIFNNETCIIDYIDSLKQILPEDLYVNFINAYEAYGSDDESDICDACDQFFYKNEQMVIDILQEYANTLEI